MFGVWMEGKQDRMKSIKLATLVLTISVLVVGGIREIRLPGYGQTQNNHLQGIDISEEKSPPGYSRTNWKYNSYLARKSLGCSRSEHVDHVVALKEAYDSGASNWSSRQKYVFANDPDNFMCLDAQLNRDKSDGDLAEWAGGTCSLRQKMAKIMTHVKNKYGLTIDSAEKSAIVAALNNPCGTPPKTPVIAPETPNVKPVPPADASKSKTPEPEKVYFSCQKINPHLLHRGLNAN